MDRMQISTTAPSGEQGNALERGEVRQVQARSIPPAILQTLGKTPRGYYLFQSGAGLAFVAYRYGSDLLYQLSQL